MSRMRFSPRLEATYSYENSRERTPVPAYDFDPVFVNRRNSEVAVCVTFVEDKMRYSSGEFFTRAGAKDVMRVNRSVRMHRDYPLRDAYPARVWNKAFKYVYMLDNTLNSDFVAAPLIVYSSSTRGLSMLL